MRGWECGEEGRELAWHVRRSKLAPVYGLLFLIDEGEDERVVHETSRCRSIAECGFEAGLE